MRIHIKASDMHLGDVVIGSVRSTLTGLGAEHIPGGYSAATVIAVNETEVTLYRPYVHTSDTPMQCSRTGVTRVIAYIGTETYMIERNNSTVFVVSRSKYDYALRGEERPS